MSKDVPPANGFDWGDLKGIMAEAYDKGESYLTLNYLCFLTGWKIQPGLPAREATATTVVDRIIPEHVTVLSHPVPIPRLQIDRFVEEFMNWKLPETVCPDSCTSMLHSRTERYGRNLLTADEARQLFEYLASQNVL